MGVLIQDSGNFDILVGKFEHSVLEYWQDTFTDSIQDSMLKEFFTDEQSDNPTEAIAEMVGAIDYTKWNGEFVYGTKKEGDSKIWIPTIWQAGMAYDRFLLSNAKLISMKDEFGDFAIGAARHREACGSGLFTYADKTSFNVNGTDVNWTLTANGLPLASNAQTSANYSTTQDNLEALELNEENLEILCQKMFDTKDENGKDSNLQPTTLVVPTALRKKGLELIGGEGKVDSSDNNPNIYNGSMRLVVWKNFRRQAGKTGQTWFIMDDKMAKKSTKWINRLESGDMYDVISWKNYETQTWRVGSIMWYSCGSKSWRPYQFSIPA